MAEIFAFPTDGADLAEAATAADHDRFLLDEGLELLDDFRSIGDRDVRDTLRALVRSLALASRRATGTAG